MKQNRDLLIKALLAVAAIIVIFSSLSRIMGSNSKTLSQYAEENPEIAYKQSEASEVIEDSSMDYSIENNENETDINSNSPTYNIEKNTSPNGDTMIQERITFASQFYYEPLSEQLTSYITGISYPADHEDLEVTFEDLRYLHILHYDFEGNISEGDIICNLYIAQDLIEIFYKLFQNQYQIEKVRLIDEYDGNDDASMEDNNSSCFNYRLIEGSTSLSKHAYGIAIDINPLYNPYITYNDDYTTNVVPANSVPFVDRNADFPYKIDKNDLCYQLFMEYGFTWGGDWNSCKDYQHFQKSFIE